MTPVQMGIAFDDMLYLMIVDGLAVSRAYYRIIREQEFTVEERRLLRTKLFEVARVRNEVEHEAERLQGHT